MRRALQSTLWAQHLNCILRRWPRNNSSHLAAALAYGRPTLVRLDIKHPDHNVYRQYVHKLDHTWQIFDIQQPTDFIARAYNYSDRYKPCQHIRYSLPVHQSGWRLLISKLILCIDDSLGWLHSHEPDAILSVRKHLNGLLDDASTDYNSTNRQCWSVKRRHSLRTANLRVDWPNN